MADEPMDDAALFAAVTNETAGDAAPAEVSTEAPATTTAEPSRDDHGRFASKPAEQTTAETTPATAAEAAIEPDASGMVPQQALHEARQQAKQERESRERLERELAAFRTPPAQPQPPAPKKEIWDDPDAWANELISPVQREMQVQKLQVSRLIAESKFGEDVVKAADDALGVFAKGDPDGAKDVAKKIAASNHPYRTLVDWHKEQETRRRIGNDPDAFVTSELEKMMGDPAKKAALLARLTGAPAAVEPAAPSAKPSQPIPPSLSRLSAAPVAAASGGQQSDQELFATVTGRR